MWLCETKMDRLTLCFGVCSLSSPAGRCNPDADRGSEGEGGCSHRAVNTDPRAADTETQPDSNERRDMTKRCTAEIIYTHTHIINAYGIVHFKYGQEALEFMLNFSFKGAHLL